jgi:chloramphenicol 3-O-phosphotransferase
MQVYHAATEEQARAMIRKCDSERRAGIEQEWRTDWLDATNYHLALDTSTASLDELADLIVQYRRLRAR